MELQRKGKKFHVWVLAQPWIPTIMQPTTLKNEKTIRTLHPKKEKIRNILEGQYEKKRNQAGRASLAPDGA